MRRILLVCLSIFLLSGCAQARVIDDLGMINAIGYDLNEESEAEKLKVTATFPIITKDGMYDRKTIVVDAKSSKAAREKLKLETNLQLESGQLRVGIFGSKLAKQGLLPHIDTFVRDPNIGSRVRLAIGKNGASEIIKLKIENEGQNATYLEQFFIKLHNESRATNYNIYQFLRDVYDDGIDPILPAFKVAGDNIKFDGIGLFKEDVLLDYLNPTDTSMLFLLREEIKRGDIDLTIEVVEGKEAEIMLSYVQSKHRIKVNSVKKGNQSVTIKVEILGDVLEYTGEEDLSDPKMQKKAEKLINEQLNKKGNKLISKLQELGVDSIGVGRYFRNKMDYREWKKINWHEAYQDVDVKVDISVKFSSNGKWK